MVAHQKRFSWMVGWHHMLQHHMATCSSTWEENLRVFLVEVSVCLVCWWVLIRFLKFLGKQIEMIELDGKEWKMMALFMAKTWRQHMPFVIGFQDGSEQGWEVWTSERQVVGRSCLCVKISFWGHGFWIWRSCTQQGGFSSENSKIIPGRYPPKPAELTVLFRGLKPEAQATPNVAYAFWPN